MPAQPHSASPKPVAVEALLVAAVGRPVVREEQVLWEPVRSEAARLPEWAVLARLVAPQRALGAVVTTAAARAVALLELALI
ncbi:MAG TPA: hypothetical protein VE133_15615 [Candidatus Sulfotelmatobacter sp.]|nr:hypothetical protein [Candidatus Sulfotelmatobacter sp.]